jgi:ribosomal protein S18 acetylase RimI-like enzyme
VNRLGSLRRAVASDLNTVVALQRAAYAPNREILGVEPIPLIADYLSVFRNYEIWLADNGDKLAGVLILQVRPADLLIWSVATAPEARGGGIGNRLLAAAETRAIQLGRPVLRLFTGEKLAANIAWYQRHGYVLERIEERTDRRLVHLMKTLGGA